jgi:hypothetical protein
MAKAHIAFGRIHNGNHNTELRTILVSDWLISKKIFSSETAFPNELKFGRKHLWKVLYKEYSFCFRSIDKHGHHRQFLFLIGRFLNIFSSESQMNQNLVGSILGRYLP